MILADDDSLPTVEPPSDVLSAIGAWFKANAGKLIYLAVVCVVAWIVARLLSRLVRRTLERSNVPDASIFVNLTRVLVWVVALTLVLKPVFGVSPATLFASLGIVSVAISLGLKDSVANTISGFQLMFSHVLQPGDMVTVSGVTGEVQDVTWRQTVVRERSGDIMMIPNSILNTTTLEKLNPANEAAVTIPFTAKPGVDMDVLTRELLGKVNEKAHGLMNPRYVPTVRFTGFSPYGVTGQVVAYAGTNVSQGALTDAVARAIGASDMFSDLAASGDETAKDLRAPGKDGGTDSGAAGTLQAAADGTGQSGSTAGQAEAGAAGAGASGDAGTPSSVPASSTDQGTSRPSSQGSGSGSPAPTAQGAGSGSGGAGTDSPSTAKAAWSALSARFARRVHHLRKR